MTWRGAALVAFGVVALVSFALWIAWWSTGQFFEGARHWAAFWILLMLTSASGSRR